MQKKDADIKKFVEKIDNMKKLNPKDLSSDQDLSIAIMNLIAIEEHLAFTGAKTEKTSYYDILPEIHAMRRGLLEKIIKHYEGEVWCTSKHLLSASMRLMEVGMKQMDMGNSEDGYKMFDQSYELYCLFWGLNMNAINLKDVAWVKDAGISLDEIQKHVANAPAAAKAAASKSAPAQTGGMMSKLKAVVKKAVNCCIE
ncbi:MAG: hypothetical protein LBL52_02680 [Rickettsiales bacterium]|jgi:hypothetical protein|nr:hypothetical protein [Rickettsiales bacterium]